MKSALVLLLLGAYVCLSAGLELEASVEPTNTMVKSSSMVQSGTWVDAMNEAVSFLIAETTPNNWGDYMESPSTQGSFGHALVGADNYDTEMASWPIPREFEQDAAACVGLLVLAASRGQYIGQSFVFNLAAGQGSLVSLVVVAKRQDAPADPARPVDVAYYVFSSHAAIKPQFTKVSYSSCSRCGNCLWMWECCCSGGWRDVPRGLTPAEVMTISLRFQDAQYSFYKSNLPVAAHSKKKATRAPLRLKSKSPLSDILKALARFVKRPEVKEEATSNYTDPIVAELQNVTQTIVSSTSHNHLKGVKTELFDRLMAALTKAYNVYDILFPYFELDHYAPAFSHEIMFQPEESSTMQYVWIMGTRDDTAKTHEVFLLSTKCQFDISRGNVSGDVKVVRTAVPSDEGSFDSATFNVLEAPWGDNTTEVSMDILRYLAASSVVDKSFPTRLTAPPATISHPAHADVGLQIVRGPQDLGKSLAVVESIIAITTAVKAIADTWQSVANAFKTTIQQDVKQIIRLGFNHFHQKSTVMKAMSVKEDKVEPLVELIIKAFKLPDDDKAKLVLFEMQYLPEATWDADDFMYAIPGTGYDKAFMMFKTGNSTSGLADFLVVNIEADFALAPDLLVVRTQRSFLGGIFQDDKTRVSEIPHVLSMNDAVQLQNFFKIVAMGKMCEVLGIPYTFPTLPPL